MSEKKRPEDMSLNELLEAVEAKDPDALAFYSQKLITPETKASLKEMAEAVSSAFSKLKPSFEQMRAFYTFYNEHKEAYDALTDAEKAIGLIKSLTLEDLREVAEEDTATKAWSFIEKAQNASEVDATELYYAALDCLEIIDFIALYELNNTRRHYRTRAKAKEQGAITEAPNSLAIPTLSKYQYSMSLYQDGGAYLQPLSSTDGLKFKNGKMYFDGARMREVSEVELQNMKTKEGIDDIDLPILRTFYSIILTQFEASGYKVLQDVLTMSVPTLAEFIGLQSNLNKKDIGRVIEKTQSYHNIVGVVHGTRNGRPVQSLYPVLNFEGYNDKTNTISFSSPYMNYVIKTVYNLSLKKSKDGKVKLKKNGEPLRLASHSYLIDSSIAKERNKAAVENVVILVTLIEQAGDNIPRIKASTIIERNVQLAERLEAAKNPRSLLKTTFTKTWELLRTKTRLQEVYNDIKLPDPNDPFFMPTMKTLDTVVFEFPHNGKK